MPTFSDTHTTNMTSPAFLSKGSLIQRGLSCCLVKLGSHLQKCQHARRISGLSAQLSRLSVQPKTCMKISNTGLTPSAGSTQQGSLLQASLPYYNSSRTAVRFSLSRGQPKTVKAVPLRFFRLRSGIWIRTWPGRKKRLWKRNEETRLRFKYHIFCNKTQSRMLDKMVTKYWKRPRFYPDDPYEPYHRRHGLDHHGQYAEQKIPGVPKWYP